MKPLSHPESIIGQILFPVIVLPCFALAWLWYRLIDTARRLRMYERVGGEPEMEQERKAA